VVGHDPEVSADLHADPAVLRATATAVEALLPILGAPGLDDAELGALARLPGGAAVVAEHDRLLAAAARTRRALAELAGGLAATAGALAATEHAAARSLRALSP
jgi:hypothetical protein